jgi:predicted acylesterase/phospholipase RssA/CRP-like cAMP-binding protein
MNDDIQALLTVHDYFRGASEQALRDVLESARVRAIAAGEVVHEPEDSVVSVGFILRGRLKAVRIDAQGRESTFRVIERGGQLGLMLGALQEPVPVRVFALEPSVILELDYDQAMELTLRHRELRRRWLKTYAGSLLTQTFGISANRVPLMLGLLHESPDSRRTTERLLERLRGVGEKLAVFSDSPEWRKLPDVRCCLLRPDQLPLRHELIRRQISAWQDATRIVFDLRAQMPAEEVERMMKLVDRVIYFVPESNGEVAVARLRSLNVAARGWRDKLAIAWLLEPGQSVAPGVTGLRDLICRDFKLAESMESTPWGRSLNNGLERLIHDLRGIRIGVALGGGAARGMSHLGVLKTLERNGIVADVIAGTSAGAMTGVVYAAGLDPEYSASQFTTDLRPSWFFRHLPRGNHWHLLYKYRRGHFDRMLRRYLRDWRLEQLHLPCVSVTVDLVGGTAVVRQQGDATHAVLESINLPLFSAPIVREGQALIDGGLVNNIPADVLVAMGCNFVIAVSVTANMERRFGDIRPDGPPPRKRPSTIQTILRSLLVQNHSLNAHGVQPADVVIAPDVTQFDATEFMRAKELAAVGEAAAADQIPKIRQLLTRLDPQLFPFFGGVRAPMPTNTVRRHAVSGTTLRESRPA